VWDSYRSIALGLLKQATEREGGREREVKRKIRMARGGGKGKEDK
jgi:hypothetical protein